jgi:chloramphenicol-sensitive protein RarD
VTEASTEPAKGVLYGIAAYGTWGIVAIYFKTIRRVAPLEILAHRIVWSVVVLVAIVSVLRRWPALIRVARDARSVRLLCLSTFLVAANWYAFIWAVTHEHLMDASLGYFMNPLVNVLLGFLVLRERLRALEWASVALAVIAVAWLAIAAGIVPWISLTVAVTFGLYGLVRKIAAVPAIEGLTLETAILLPIAAGYLIHRAAAGTGAFRADSVRLDLLLIAAGPVTAIPLIWFAAAVQRLRLATLGLLQYLSPTIQFVVAVAIYHEPFGHERLLAFVLIWCAIVMYSGANVWSARRSATP